MKVNRERSQFFTNLILPMKRMGRSNIVCPATDQRGFVRPLDGDKNGR